MKIDVTYRIIAEDVVPDFYLNMNAGHIEDGVFYPIGSVAEHFSKLQHEHNKNNTHKEEFVYFIQSVNGGPIKIGYAENVNTRLNELQIGNPEELQVIKTIRGGRDVETTIHEAFKQYRLRGEWFNAEIYNEVLEL